MLFLSILIFVLVIVAIFDRGSSKKSREFPKNSDNDNHRKHMFIG